MREQPVLPQSVQAKKVMRVMSLTASMSMAVSGFCNNLTGEGNYKTKSSSIKPTGSGNVTD